MMAVSQVLMSKNSSTVLRPNLGQEAAENGPDDPDDDRHDDAARVVAGHDGLGDEPASRPRTIQPMMPMPCPFVAPAAAGRL